MRGWNYNLVGEKKKLKVRLIEEMADFEISNEQRHLGNSEFERWTACQLQFKQILSEEESYWQQRAKLQWFLEGDVNTKFFHICASNRRRKKIQF